MEMAKLKLSGAAVLLIIVVPMFMYTGALLIGVQLGRALERRPDSAGVSFTIRGALAYLANELWDANNVLGLGRRGAKHDRAAKVWVPVALSFADESSAANNKQHQSKERRSYIPYPRVTNTISATPKAQRYSYYTNDTLLQLQPMSGVISVGPWGGSGGQPFYMRGDGSSPPRLRSIMLHHSSSGIFSLACEYTLAGDEAANQIRRAGPWGRSQTTELRHATIKLCAGEHVTAVEGTAGYFSTVPGVVITSLTFRTNNGRTYGPYGRTTGTPFSTVPAADGACIVGFWGRSGWLLDAIGVYVRPACY